MFSNKENINILTRLLMEHGVERAVVCPGSRNAPIVHNLSRCGSITCHPVTDERSAGFVAFGIAQATRHPVVVCVTSGTALLNLVPAVAEAHYQHLPLIVVSADRPLAWIGQLDGQTLPQADALGHFVRKAVTLPEPKDEVERWHCNRLVNEALCMAVHRSAAPVHINVPVTEPLFDFTMTALPEERVFRHLTPDRSVGRCSALEEALRGSSRPMLVIGQTDCRTISRDVVEEFSRSVVVFHEALGCEGGAVPFDEALCAVQDNPDYAPDLVIYIGGTIVSKRARRFLRAAKAPTYFLTTNGTDIPDPTMWLAGIVECGGAEDFNLLLRGLTGICGADASGGGSAAGRKAFRNLWQQALAEAGRLSSDYEPSFSQMAVVKYFEEQMEDLYTDFRVHYANSSAVRLANIYARHYIWCNRGTNGIEGCLSTAVGFSLAVGYRVFCVIGDLSFFYDQNALWNTCVGGNLRIILLNNGCGGLFHQLPGLERSSARDTLVAGAHKTGAEGICMQNDVGYMQARNMREMQLGVVTLLTRESSRPMLLEVFTDVAEDSRVVEGYFALHTKSGPYKLK